MPDRTRWWPGLRLRPLSLRQMLTLPYVVLVLVLVLLIGALSYRAGRATVDNLSGQLLQQTVSSINLQLEDHLSDADEALETAFPEGLPPPRLDAGEQDGLRMRLWQAASLHRDPNNYVYYADQSGRFIGLWRFSVDEAELRLRQVPGAPRTFYRISSIGGTPHSPRPETQHFEPRERPWYQQALKAAQPQA